MKEFTYKEKIATLKLLDEIIHADKKVDEREVKYFWEVATSFGLDEGCKVEVDEMPTTETLSVIGGMADDQKELVSQKMGRMVVIDEDINYNEVVLYNGFCKTFGIEKEFDRDEYPF